MNDFQRMQESEKRRQALEMAIKADGRPPAEVLQAAEKFSCFLTGGAAQEPKPASVPIRIMCGNHSVLYNLEEVEAGLAESGYYVGKMP